MNIELIFFSLGAMGIVAGYLLLLLWMVEPKTKPSKAECSHEYCSSRPDPRCVATNCTYHCQSASGCNARCLDAWVKSDKAVEISKAILEKARAK